MRASRAFTLIEVILVVAIMGIMVAAIPRILGRPKDKWPSIINGFNNLVALARQEAITKRKVHRLEFFSKEGASDAVALFREEDDPEKEGVKIYQEVKTPYLESAYELPKTVKIQKVFVDGEEPEEELRRGVPVYITIDGMMQDTTVFLVRTREAGEDRGTLTLKPFYGEFGFEEGFVKPEKRRIVKEERVE